MKSKAIVAGLLVGAMSLVGAIVQAAPPEPSGIVAWYQQHYPFVTMTDSVFTFKTEFVLPDGFRPLDSASLSPFQNWVANFPLWHRWRSVGSWKGQKVYEADSIARPVHLPYRGPEQKDFNIPLRILAEWLFLLKREADLVYYPHAGDSLTYSDWLGGQLRLDRWGHPYIKKGEGRTATDGEYYRFMRACMDYSSYSGLTRNCDTLHTAQVLPGDLFVAHDQTGRKGVAYVVLQVLQNSTGQRLYAVATGCPDACDFHIPKLTEDRNCPWITLEKLQSLGKDWPQSGFFRLKIK